MINLYITVYIRRKPGTKDSLVYPGYTLQFESCWYFMVTGNELIFCCRDKKERWERKQVILNLAYL
jgi:hypothetical protein